MEQRHPRHRRAGQLLLEETFDFELDIAEVILADVEFQHFIDDRQQVVERAYRLQQRRIGRPDDAAAACQDQGIFNGKQRNAAIVESGSEAAVVRADDAGDTRRLSIGVEKPADVFVFGDIHVNPVAGAVMSR